MEEPSEQAVFLLCAPSADDVSATIRSRCRRVALRSASDAVAAVLTTRDGFDPAVGGLGGVGCGCSAAPPGPRPRRPQLLRNASWRSRWACGALGDAFSTAAELDRGATAEADDLSGDRDAAEREEAGIAIGAGGIGKGALRPRPGGAKAAEKELEKCQKVRNTRTRRDLSDLALIDLAGFYRDVLVAGSGAQVSLTNADRAGDVERAAREWPPESALRRLEAVLACREGRLTATSRLIAVSVSTKGARLGAVALRP